MPSQMTGNGYTFTFDEQDAALVAAHTWYGLPEHKGLTVYIARSEKLEPGRGGKQRTIMFHREVMGATRNRPVDHRDGNGLNNARDNLRLCTFAQNSRNARRSRSNTSGYKGVSWSSRHRLYRAYITVDRRKMSLGYFAEAIDGAKAYDAAAVTYFGEFARTNLGAQRAA
jgi:hypothetical protein